MVTRLHLATAIGTIAAVWGVLLLIAGVSVSADYLKPFSTVTGISMIGWLAFEKWFWKYSWLAGWFVHRPNLQGTWKAIIRPTRNAEGVVTAQEIIGYVAIRQTFTTLSFRMMTAESASTSLACEIKRSEDSLFSLVSIYRNEPKLAVRDRSPIHHGGVVLQVVLDSPQRLHGYYWTDRTSAGELELIERNSHVYSDFASASSRFQADGQNPAPGACN